jgi:hypothetical protein
MYAVGKIATTHTQWTVGEFTYAYVRILHAMKRRDYVVTHASTDGFSLYLPCVQIPIPVTHADPVPVRIVVSHGMNLTPQDMTVEGFAMVAKAIFLEAAKEVAVRCPRRASCMCRLGGIFSACGSTLGQQEFVIEGMIAKAD